MRSTYSVFAVVLTVLMAAPTARAASRADGPQHVAAQQQLDAAVQEHVRTADQDREAVRQFLQREEVRVLAGKYGIDMRQADSAAASLDGADLASVAAQARHADEALAGGASSVTISTTTIIIALLRACAR